MKTILHATHAFLASEDGPTAVEYSVMLALIVTVCVSTISALGLNTKQVCDAICNTFAGS